MISLVERRSLLLSQHEQLRNMIDRLREAAASVLMSREEAVKERAGTLAEAIGAFGNALRAHLACEEDLLGPVLERVDAWGPVRLDLMRVEHAHQRAVLDALRTDRTVAPKDIAKRAWSLTMDVLADMEAEERDLLAENVLSDDVVVLDQSDR